MKRRKDADHDKTNIGVGDSVPVKVVDIYEKIREEKIRRMNKELFFLYYLAHIYFILVVSNF